MGVPVLQQKRERKEARVCPPGIVVVYVNIVACNILFGDDLNIKTKTFSCSLVRVIETVSFVLYKLTIHTIILL
jgi:hypothetical protein